MFKVKNKDATPCSSVSIVIFEQVIADWKETTNLDRDIWT